MGGFSGSPWNFIFLEEFAAAGGARLSLSSLLYRFWSWAAFLIHISFSFFSMLFRVISMAFKAFSWSFLKRAR